MDDREARVPEGQPSTNAVEGPAAQPTTPEAG
jgi:hypothetical protein